MEDYGSGSWYAGGPLILYNEFGAAETAMPASTVAISDMPSTSQSEDWMYGSSNSLPTIGSAPQTAGQSGDVFDSVNGYIKRLGQLSTSITQTARSVGQAVGAIEGQTANAARAYNAGREDAGRGMAVKYWWDSTSTSDKAMLALTAVGVFLALRKG